MSVSKKQKSGQKKLSHPVSTATISQPQVVDTSNQSAFCSFSPEGDLFAFLSPAIDKHRLRVYDTGTNQSIAEYNVESARVTSLTWTSLDLSRIEGTDFRPLTKKRRRKNSDAAGGSSQTSFLHILIMGLSDGVVLLFSPSHARVIRRLSHSSNTAAIISVLVCDANVPTLWTSSDDSAVRIWDVQSNEILDSWKSDERIPYSCMVLRPASDAKEQQVLLAHHTIKLFSASMNSLTGSKPKLLASFTGHASQVKSLEWDISQDPPQRFCSLAEGDRFVYVWQVPENNATQGQLLVSIPLESAAVSFALLTEKPGQVLAALSASGKISVFDSSDKSIRTGQKVPTLTSGLQISTSSKTGEPATKIVSISSVVGQAGCIGIARLINGVRPIFDVTRYLDETGNFVREVVLVNTADAASSESARQTTYSKRYDESAPSAIASGVELCQDEKLQDETLQEGDLDVNLAELSLGQRLAAVSGGEQQLSGSDKEGSDGEPKHTRPKHTAKGNATTVPANSLTRTLIQALHSSDSRLLETCLAHSNTEVISNTVKRLPPQLAVPLIIACADRLGEGARSANMKGRGGGASTQRGSTLVAWIRIVLAAHSGHLMTVPDLVARLSGLHATLTTRLSLQESLLSLSGRLELVLSQMQMRSSDAPTLLGSKNVQAPKVRSAEVTKYVEGESGDSEIESDLMEMEDDIDDAGSVEDVELGGDSEGGETEESDEDSEDGDDLEEPTVNGFIDDEAEEYSQDDESDSE